MSEFKAKKAVDNRLHSAIGHAGRGRYDHFEFITSATGVFLQTQAPSLLPDGWIFRVGKTIIARNETLSIPKLQEPPQRRPRIKRKRSPG